MHPSMNHPYSSGAGGRPPPGAPPGGRMPPSMQPPARPGIDTGHGDYRLAPSYQAHPSGGPWSGGQYMFSPVNNVGGYDQASAAAAAAAVAAAQHNLAPYGRPPPDGGSPSKGQFFPNGPGGPQGPPSQGGPSPPHMQGQFAPRLDMNYMGLGAWENGAPREDERGPQSAGPDPRSSVGPGPSVANSAPHTAVKTEHEDMGAEDKVDHRKRKRNRTIRSCVPCHNHKRKCDRKRPCGRCTALGLTGSCVYEVDEARDPNDPDVIETDRLRRRIAELEQVVRELRQRHPPRGAAAQPPPVATTAVPPSTDAEKRRVIVDRYARFKIGEAFAAVGNGVMPDGTSAGNLSDASPSSSSVASVKHRDVYAEPYSAGALPGEEMVSDTQGRKTFLGTPAGKPMIRRLREIVHGKTKSLGGVDEIISVPEDLTFAGWFSSARKTYPFTTIWSHDTFIDEIVGLLPSKEESELLLTSFVDEMDMLFRAWHTPTLKAEFRHFFSLSPAEKRQQPLSNLSLYIMMCSLACMARASDKEIRGEPAPAQAQRGEAKDLTSSRLQSELYLSAAYQALRLCSFLSSPTIHTIQSQILINIYLLHSERSYDGWSLVGSLVRQCIAMGLHVDPVSLDPKISLREAEIRRRIWWTVVGLDAVFCLPFGRPTCVNYYTCNVPMDRPDEALSDEPGSAALVPSTTALGPESSSATFHAANYQIVLPSLELLNRTFHVSPIVGRNLFMGWFKPDLSDEPPVQLPTVVGNSYEDAIRFGRDVVDWYGHLPKDLSFDPDDTSLEDLTRRSRSIVNQTLTLAAKTFILVLILHRPYLRADPSAYPESSSLCALASHMLLQAYSAMVRTQSSIAWSWWTMSYRAFHAGTVCAFLAIREPGTTLGERCLSDLRRAITNFDDRSPDWMVSHPVQSDLRDGLVKLERLASAATQQSSPRMPDAGQMSPIPVFPPTTFDPPPTGLESMGLNEQPLADNTFADLMGSRRQSASLLHPWAMNTMSSAYQANEQPPLGMQLGGSGKDDAGDLVNLWASMFNIKMAPDGLPESLSNAQGLPGLQPPPT